MNAIEYPLTGSAQTVRGFEVHVRDLRSKRERWLSYPGRGQSKYTGDKAREVMERFASRGWEEADMRAYTNGFGIEETATLEEMKELFPQ